MIRSWTPLSHPNAHLTKDLEFTELHEVNRTGLGIYWPARLLVTKTRAQLPQCFSWNWQADIVRVRIRQYMLSSFGNSEYDRYQISSDLASGMVLGRVAGTEQWGHQP